MDRIQQQQQQQNGCRKAEDILHVLRDRVAQLPGTRDRNGRPVIVFPARENSTPINSDHIRNILMWIWDIISVFVLQEHFPAEVHAVLIIKPDKFWEKHKTSVSTGKYKFDVQMISVDGLTRYIDPSQLTRDLGGSLFYDHDEWLETRMVKFHSENCFESFREEMKNGEMPVDVATAERATTAHIAMKKKIVGAPIEYIQNEVERIRQRISGSSGATPDDGYSSSSGMPIANPDLAAALPNLSSLISSLRNSKYFFAK
ncbi:unnamed protein product [Gongylonema pulchrum]|uniref:CRAL-TRIO domain-containing protein n=1 Tax=Gongylonema pulchrum TaxID=637853 RepID=A0A183EI14_9BILA|nr:unnamed protein product [Gongylonema pulchrum]